MSSNGSLVDQLGRIEQEALEAVARAEDVEALEAARVTYLGRKEGRISLILRQLGGLSAEERPVVGAEANRIKNALSEALESRQATLASLQSGILAVLADRDVGGAVYVEGGGHDRWKRRTAAKASEAFISGLT